MSRTLVYLLRRDLRYSDNPILHEIGKLTSQSQRPFDKVLPIYVFQAHEIETSGFIPAGSSTKSPYPEARSEVGKFPRCGPLRAKFIAESVWDVKKSLENAGSGLEIRVGMIGDVVKHLLDNFKDGEITGVWMTDEEGIEEKRQIKAVRQELESRGKEFKVWKDEKYYVDDRDLPFDSPSKLPDIFTSFRKMVEPLRDAPRKPLSTPSKLPPLPENCPAQCAPFEIPKTFNELVEVLQKPIEKDMGLANPPKPTATSPMDSLGPFGGGEKLAHKRLHHLLKSGAMATYKDTRNGMLGSEYSTRFSAWLALGSITSRQIHAEMLDFEDGRSVDKYKGNRGFGQGENKGTAAVRFELLWRDYFRLCTRKYRGQLFKAGGFRDAKDVTWKYDDAKLKRWLEGTTGTGIVDASQRELFLTGFTSNRARQNVASYLAKHLGLDWRLGAEWYEATLVDYDLSNVSISPPLRVSFGTISCPFKLTPCYRTGEIGNTMPVWAMTRERAAWVACSIR